MAKQTIIIETAKELSLRCGMIVIVDKESGEETLRPIEDLRTLIVDNHSVRITVPLINELVRSNVCIVYCDEKHMPASMMMDLESNSLQSKRFQSQLSAAKPVNKQLWKQIVEAKIRNQSRLIEELGKGDRLLVKYYNNVKSNDTTNREGAAARIYWKVILGKDFVRDRYGAAPNALLNYGYALLRTAMARSIMNACLLPTVGIFHRNRYDAFPLADDMMEPFRPFVDRKVLQLYDRGITGVGKESKRELMELFYSDITESALMLATTTLSGVYEGSNNIVVFPQM